MVRRGLTLEEIRSSNPTMDRAKVASTTEDDIRRQQIEDGEDPDEALPPFRAVPNVRAIRRQLSMSQEAFAKAIRVPLATIRTWEEPQARMDPAVQSLMRALEREPDAVLRALAE